MASKLLLIIRITPPGHSLCPRPSHPRSVAISNIALHPLSLVGIRAQAASRTASQGLSTAWGAPSSETLLHVIAVSSSQRVGQTHMQAPVSAHLVRSGDPNVASYMSKASKPSSSIVSLQTSARPRQSKTYCDSPRQPHPILLFSPLSKTMLKLRKHPIEY